MKKFLLLTFSIIIFSCKSDEEKLNENFIKNGSQFLIKTEDSEISEVSISKIDTFRKQHELGYIAAVFYKEYEKNINTYKNYGDDYDYANNNLTGYSGLDNSEYWNKKRDEALWKYVGMKEKMEILDVNIKKYQKMAIHDTSTEIFGYNVLLKYKAKNDYGMVDYKEQNLIYFPDGQLRDLLTYKEYLFKKYKIENLLPYVQ